MTQGRWVRVRNEDRIVGAWLPSTIVNPIQYVRWMQWDLEKKGADVENHVCGILYMQPEVEW